MPGFPEEPAVQLARLQEKMNNVLEGMKDMKSMQERSFDKSEKIEEAVAALAMRTVEVENKLKATAPTIEEFITIKQKVVGAGLMGRWAWTIVVAVIGLLYTFRTQIKDLL